MDQDVSALVERLQAGVAAVLGDRLIGLYLHGSLALGGFDPGRSDIDFLVVTAGALQPEVCARLEAMHAAIASSDLAWRSNYEGSYMPTGALRRYDPLDCIHPVIRVDGSFGLDRHGSEWVIQRHVVREWGIALVGPPPATLIDPITGDHLRQATAGVLCDWWAPMLDEPARLGSGEYQAYAVLTMCRALYTWEHGAVVSKPQAARWARERLEQRWASLIDSAVAWRHGVAFDRFDETVALIRLAVGAICQRGPA